MEVPSPFPPATIAEISSCNTSWGLAQWFCLLRFRSLRSGAMIHGLYSPPIHALPQTAMLAMAVLGRSSGMPILPPRVSFPLDPPSSEGHVSLAGGEAPQAIASSSWQQCLSPH